MSQTINLLLPELRPRLDWLSLAVVAPGGLAALLLVAVNAAWLGYEQHSLKVRESLVAGELKAAQARMQAMAKENSARKSDPRLAQEAERLAASLKWRKEALQLLQAGGLGDNRGFAPVMAGLARQSMDGLWLTGFRAAGGEFELHGRLLDPALLPVYIRRLNAEPAFQGRRFAELDMKSVSAKDADTAPPANAPAPAGRPVAPRRGPVYTEFSLRTHPAPLPKSEKPGTGGQP